MVVDIIGQRSNSTVTQIQFSTQDVVPTHYKCNYGMYVRKYKDKCHWSSENQLYVHITT